jgi:hypothetical protein
VTVIVVVPTGKKEPEAWLLLISPQLPMPSALEKLTNAPGSPLKVVFASVVMSLGQSSVQVLPGAPAVTSFYEVEVLSGVWSSVVSLLTVEVPVIKVPTATPLFSW